MQWVQQPPERASNAPGRSKYTREAAELRDNPGRWALLSSADSVRLAQGRAHSIRSGKVAAFADPEHWEVVARGCDVYIRFLP